MSLSKLVAWAGTIVFLLIMLVYSKQFSAAEPEAKGILALETAGKAEANTILTRWHDDNGHLADVARKVMIYDFFFIIFYVWLLVMLSSNQMYREAWLPLNSLLRLNIPLAILAGLFDITENILLLHNMHYWNSPASYIVSSWATFPKFILAGWIILVWIISAVKGFFRK